MNRINQLFQTKPGNILSIYFTAGHPEIHSTPSIIKNLANSGADMIEIGMPFSDPMADGPIIQNSSTIALKNGMNLKLLFSQLEHIRNEVQIPLLLMGYLNPVLQFGLENFCSECFRVGIDGIILPDLPLDVFRTSVLLSNNSSFHFESIKELFTHYNLHNIFLISPQTSADRVQAYDQETNSFLYFVSSSSTTGVKEQFGTEQLSYFERISRMPLKNPALVGFGISNHESFSTVCRYTNGAIIGSAFVKMLSQSGNQASDIEGFIREIRGDKK